MPGVDAYKDTQEHVMMSFLYSSLRQMKKPWTVMLVNMSKTRKPQNFVKQKYTQ